MVKLEEVHQSEECSKVYKTIKFPESLESLFDISHRDALAMIKIEEKVSFSLLRGRKGVWGSMVKVRLRSCFIRKRGK